jgi:hypothetical protein
LYGLVLVVLLVSVQADPLWKVFCSGKPLFRGRLDPLVQPGVVGYHVHKVAGSNKFSAGSLNQSPLDVYKTIFSSSCTTCSIKTVDNSQYWHPELYYQWPNGTFSLVPDGGLTVYYESRGGFGNQTHPDYQPFPPGFRMVAGNPIRRTFSGTTDELAVSFVCLGNPSAPEGNKMPTDKYFCSNGFRAQIYFPMCWNGKDIDSPDHKSHMAYPTSYNLGNCPPTHPVRVPGVFFEAFYSVDQFPHGKGTQPFVWACGDQTGYGFHGDFLNGWDPNVMRAALKDPKCDGSNTANGNNVKACPPLAAYVQDTPEAACQLATPIPLTEDLGMGHPIPTLPGCNPITTTTQPACAGPIQPSKAKAPRYLIKSKVTGKYLSSNPPITNPMMANVDVPTLTEVWDPNPVPGGVCLLSEDNGKYASADGTDGMLYLNRGSVSQWETFNFENQPNGYVAIKALRNNMYLNVTEFGNLEPTEAKVIDSCLFTLEVPNGGNFH